VKADPNLPSEMERIRQAACRDKKLRFTTLWHHVYDIEHLRGAYFSLKRNAATGVDDETWRHYGEQLEENLQELSDRLKRGAYRAKPVKRAYIPKPDGRQRPLGVTTLEDKIVQRGAVEVLNAIYEMDFLGFSYGFRPGRSPHDALNALYAGIMTRKVSWVLDADIRGHFDGISHEWLVEFIEHRIADKRVISHIRNGSTPECWKTGIEPTMKRAFLRAVVLAHCLLTCICITRLTSGSNDGDVGRLLGTLSWCAFAMTLW